MSIYRLKTQYFILYNSISWILYKLEFIPDKYFKALLNRIRLTDKQKT